jgi:Type IV secretion system pilin
MKSRWLLSVFAILAIVPALTFAAHIPVRQDVWDVSILAGPITVCTGSYLGSGGTPSQTITTTGGNSVTFPATVPCQNLCDLFAQIIAFLYYFMAVGIWIIIPIMFLWSGVKLMISRGDPAKTSEARKMVTGAVIGVAIMLCAYLIVSAFIGFLKIPNVVGGFGGAAACEISK